MKPLFPDQEFFNMGEASRIVQLPDYTLRYWESKLRLLRPVRRESGHRRYTKKDLETILRVKDMLYNQHMTLSGARKVLVRKFRGGAPRNLESSNGTTADAPKPTDAAILKVLRELRSDLKEILSDL